MNITNFSQKIKQFLEGETIRDLYIVFIIILVAFSSFGLGRLSKIEESKEPVRIEYPLELASVSEVTSPLINPLVGSDPTNGSERNFVASKNGTKYHFPWCGGAKQMKEENKIWFATKEEAEAAGYTKALNCKGL